MTYYSQNYAGIILGSRAPLAQTHVSTSLRLNEIIYCIASIALWPR